MKLILHKLKEGFVITSDEEIRKGDLVIKENGIMNYAMGLDTINTTEMWSEAGWKKVIAQQDQIDFSALTEEEYKMIGWVDCLKFAKEYFQAQREFHQDDFYRNAEPHQKDELYKRHDDLMSPIFVAGFQKAQELLSDRMFTEQDVEKIVKMCQDNFLNSKGISRDVVFKRVINSLIKTSWEIEVEMETIGECDCPCHDPKFIIMHFMPCCYPQTVPKFTNNKIKIIKIF